MAFGDEKFFLSAIVLFALVALCMHFVNKHTVLLALYGAQSLMLTIALLTQPTEKFHAEILGIIAFSFVVKVIGAPLFFFRVVQRYKVTFLTRAHLNIPVRFTVVILLLVVASTSVFAPITAVAGQALQSYNALLLGSVFISLFLMVNSRGALAQIIGMLSLENCVVMLALGLGLAQSLTFELGMIFDLVVWIGVARVFVSMVHRQMGSLDIANMAALKEE